MTTTHIGKAEVINCDFVYECPLDWFQLTLTDDPSIRHCGTCHKNVYFCRDASQLVLLKRYLPDACAAMHSGSIRRIDRSSIRMGVPRMPPLDLDGPFEEPDPQS